MKITLIRLTNKEEGEETVENPEEVDNDDNDNKKQFNENRLSPILSTSSSLLISNTNSLDQSKWNENVI